MTGAMDLAILLIVTRLMYKVSKTHTEATMEMSGIWLIVFVAFVFVEWWL